MATLGNATGASTDVNTVGMLYVCGSAAGSGYLATENGTITKITIKFQGSTNSDAVFKAVVYSETAGLPAAQVCYSNNVTVAQSSPAAEVDFSTLNGSTSLVNGTRYWIGLYLVSNPGNGAPYFMAPGSSGIAKFKSAQPDPPPDPFPSSPSSDTDQMWSYVTYTPAAAAIPYAPKPNPNFIYLRRNR